MKRKIDEDGHVIVPEPDRDWLGDVEIPPDFDVLKAIDEDREERIHKIWGETNP